MVGPNTGDIAPGKQPRPSPGPGCTESSRLVSVAVPLACLMLRAQINLQQPLDHWDMQLKVSPRQRCVFRLCDTIPGGPRAVQRASDRIARKGVPGSERWIAMYLFRPICTCINFTYLHAVPIVPRPGPAVMLDRRHGYFAWGITADAPALATFGDVSPQNKVPCSCSSRLHACGTPGFSALCA